MSISDKSSSTNRSTSPPHTADLARLLRELNKDFERRVYQELAARGYPDVRASHGPIFSNLGADPVRVTELAQRTQVTQQAMGKMLKELELMGYVARNVDETDKRAKDIELTVRGHTLLQNINAAVEAARVHYSRRIGAQPLDELEQRLRDAASALELEYLPDNWTEAPDAGDRDLPRSS